MHNIRVEMAKAKRKCRECGGAIPKFHTALVMWEEKRLPDRTVMVKHNFCSKCGSRKIERLIAAVRGRLDNLAGLKLMCQRDYVPEESRPSVHYIQKSGSPTNHILRGRLTEKTLCGREINGGFHKMTVSPAAAMRRGDTCRNCLRVWLRERADKAAEPAPAIRT